MGRRHGQAQDPGAPASEHGAHRRQKAEPGTASSVQGTATGEHRHAHNAAAGRGAPAERAALRRRCQLEECGPKNGSTGDEAAGGETATRSPSEPSRTRGEREEGAAKDGGEDGGDAAGNGAGGAAAERTDSHCAR